MIFQSTITNDQTAELPSAHFDGRIVVVDREEQIEAACRDLASHRIIGFDTETRPSFKAGVTNKVSLLQLSTPTHCYLIRLCRTKLHSLLLKILSSPDIIKIGADVAGDIRSLHALRHFKERGFVDLQQIASSWGIEEKSLRKMSAIVLGKRVSKAQRLSNWEASTLTPQQQMYAATDAWVCIEIYNKLMSVEPLQPIPTYISEQERAQAERLRKEQKERTKPRRRHRGRKRENSEKKE
ncbi:MAG: 3'-5' exonuclease domain-containing protein 2 [Alistipes sp.]|jgi:ribonuclease D|nr:3'-5' exonuclease domain-containing protein 2 [Alistipes sp.]MBR0333044.1 3'-5' exonuclease domain-containing protein 2 [Alistipes sp.]